jgi:alkylation response protein AidB-like acyl-CoA dehydrogenase
LRSTRWGFEIVNFDRTEEQQLLAASIARFVERDYGFEKRGKIVASDEGWDRGVWSTFAELGLLGLPIPADYGGFGGGAVDMMSVMEAIGGALIVEPYLSTVGVGAQFVSRGGTSEQKARFLPAIAEGRLRMAFAQTEHGARYDPARVATRARSNGDGYAIDGTKRVALDAPAADWLIVSARIAGNDSDRDGIALFLVDPNTPGVRMKALRTLDGARAADIEFSDVRVGRDALLGDPGQGIALIDEVVDFATALVCAEAVGVMKFANDATLDYLKTRRQFGVPIGSFQALAHRMVDMVISHEQARSMASLACATVEAERDPARRMHVVSAAKIRIADACRQVSQEAVQLHGGMGMSDEMPISHAFRRLTRIARQFGDADHHLERFAATE